MKFLLALLILLLGVSSGLAVGNKSLRAIPYAITQCPYPVDNGCSSSQPLQANSGAVLLSNARQAPAGNMINLLTGNPTDYSAVALPRNQPAIDYPVGAYKSFTALKQINNTTATAAGCTYNATGSVGGTPLVTCTPGVGATLNFVDFDMTNGGTTCVGLKISGDNGIMNVSDVYILNNGVCAISAAQPVMLVTSGRNTATTNVSFVTLDANVANFPYKFGACARDTATTPALACNPYEAYLVSGDFHIDHSAFIGFAARPLQYFAADVSVGSFAQYNALIGCCSLQASAHSEYEEYIGPTGGGGMTWVGNTFISTTFHHTSGFAAFPVWLGTVAGPVPVFDMENNFYVDAMAGGGGSNTIPTWAGSITGGVFTTSSVTGGKLGSGMQSTCGAARSVGGVGTFEVNFLPIYAGLSGTQSAGPGGGGFNTLSNGAQFNMSWSQTVVTAGIDNGSGINPTYTATFNKATGALTITSAVTGGAVATGQIISGAGIPGQPVISSGSGTNWVTTTPGGGSGILSGVTIVSGTPGNVVNVSVDNALVLVPGTNGDTIDFLSGAGTRTLTAFGTASGTTGTYIADASGYSPQAQLTATPFDVWPGGWSVPGTLTCASQTSAFRAASFSKPFMTNQGTMGQVTATGNYLDLWAYGNTPLGSATVVNNNAVLQTFNGTITTGTTLTVNSGTTPTVGRYITTDSGVAANTLITGSLGGGQFSITPSQTNLGPVSMVATETYCTTGPTVFGSPGNNPNVDMSGINPETTMDSYGTSVISGNGCSPGNVAFALPTSSTLKYINPAGNDACNGTSPSLGSSGACAWLSPNHTVKCGEVIIAAAGAYNSDSFDSLGHGSSRYGTPSSCPSTTGGIDGTGGVYVVAIVCGGSFVGACSINATTQHAVWIDKSNWAIEGFYATNTFDGTSSCFMASPINPNPAIGYVAFINNTAANCTLSGFQSGGAQTNNVDEFAVVGTVEYNSAASGSFCGSGISTFPSTFDALAGTHQFLSQNFSFGNIDGPCSANSNSQGGYPAMAALANAGASSIVVNSVSGWGLHWPIGATGGAPTYPFASSAIVTTGATPTLVSSVSGTTIGLSNNVAAPGLTNGQQLAVGTSTDGEGIILDTWGGTYAGAAVVKNNIAFSNGSSGFEFFCNTGPCASGLTVTFTQNTSYGNLQDYKHDGSGFELIDGGAGSFTWNVTNNIFQSTVTKPANSQTFAAWNGTTGVGANGTGQPVTAAGFGKSGYNVTGNVFFGASGATCPSGATCNGGAGNNAIANYNTASYGSGNTFTDPTFASVGSLPSSFTNCNAFTNVVACMAPVITALTSGSAPTKGYQSPAPCQPDASYPTWLKGVVYLQWNGTSLTENADLITKPCGL